MITSRTVEWARQHDWFVSERRLGPNEYEITCCCDECDREGNWHRVTEVFTDRSELRSWAGY